MPTLAVAVDPITLPMYTAVEVSHLLSPGAERKVKVLINTDSTQDCLLGTSAQEELGFTLILPDGQEILRSPAPTVERYSKESEPKDSTSKTSLPTIRW